MILIPKREKQWIMFFVMEFLHLSLEPTANRGLSNN